ncbi:MAG: diacylglycerol/lipid kinase family protein [Candidatus Dormibacteria bacterium]
MSRSVVANIACIVNPASAGGATGKTWDAWSSMLDKAGLMHVTHATSGRNDAIGATRQLLREGHHTIIAVGGDGTINEVVNGFFSEDGTPINPDATLAIFPRGTGCDFRRTLRIPLDIEGCIAVLAAGNVQSIDVGKVAFDLPTPSTRYFVNIADCGVGGAIARRVNSSPLKAGGFRGTAVFLGISLQTLLTYPDPEVTVEVDGSLFYTGPVSNVVVANGQYFGGGMKVAPNARLDDGTFDILVLAPDSRIDAIRGLANIYNGSHLHQKGVLTTTGSTVRIAAPDSQEEDVLFDIEGEQIGTVPATITCLPQALKMYIPTDQTAEEEI